MSITHTVPAECNVSGWRQTITNMSGQDLIINPSSGLINGGYTLTVPSGCGGELFCDGTDFYFSSCMEGGTGGTGSGLTGTQAIVTSVTFNGTTCVLSVTTKTMTITRGRVQSIS